MKSKLLSGIAIAAVLAMSAVAAVAQQAPPSPPAPAEKMVEPPTPAPAAKPSASVDKSTAAAASEKFATQQSASEWRSTKIVGLNVYNANNEKIGDINDLILDADGKIASAVIGVGGFLGMGEKLVAVPFSELKFDRDADGNLRVTLASSKETLQNAPAFKYL